MVPSPMSGLFFRNENTKLIWAKKVTEERKSRGILDSLISECLDATEYTQSWDLRTALATVAVLNFVTRLSLVSQSLSMYCNWLSTNIDKFHHPLQLQEQTVARGGNG